MAPRPKRPKLTRMDAALDAMRPMGFADHVVRKCVRDLLKVYDGNDGWPFIEEASYMLLIQTLIDEGEEEEEEEEEEQQEEEQRQHQQPIVEHNGEAGEEFVQDKEICEEEGVRVDHHLSDQDVVDKEVCEEDVPVKENPFLLQDEHLHFGGHDHFSRAQTPPMVDCPPTLRRRKPCYGWISDDDEEDDDIPVHSTSVECRDSD